MLLMKDYAYCIITVNITYEMKILIIEDEKKAAKELENILLDIDDSITILATIGTVVESVAFLQALHLPDLIFSDIQLSDGLCFEIFKQVNIKCPIIFYTAHSDYIMEAFTTNALSYLLKPITKKSVWNAIDKYQRFKTAFAVENIGNPIEENQTQFNMGYKTNILVERKDSIIPLLVNKIAYLYLRQTFIEVITFDNQKYFLYSTLEKQEQVLDPEIFYRANRHFIINRSSILNVNRFFARKLIVKLVIESPEDIVISKANVSNFLHWL
jgi:two-component system, LytTR family, response regulator LytT